MIIQVHIYNYQKFSTIDMKQLTLIHVDFNVLYVKINFKNRYKNIKLMINDVVKVYLIWYVH